MGLDSNGVKFLLYGKRLGVDFESSAMIGRQYMLAGPDEVRYQFLRAGMDPEKASAVELATTRNAGYGEGLLEQLGAKKVTSFDASDYEQATYVHDFNHPLPDQFKSAYSLVLDGGTLEHIFNYPTALRNCMEMVREGGHFMSITPANNFPGHGFYQLSPELFFRVFCRSNGFELVDIILVEDYPGAPWYRVRDPESAKHRVIFWNSRSTYLLVIAKRSSVKPLFASFPQQTDYLDAWEGGMPNKIDRRGPIARLRKAIYRRLKGLVRPHSIRYESGDLTHFDPFTIPTFSKRTL